MTALRVGFEASDLYPERTGLYTYASQLLWGLTRLPDAPTLTLLDGHGRKDMAGLLAANDGVLPTDRFAEGRPLPLLHLTKGFWQRRYIRSLGYRIDHHVIVPAWQAVEDTPFWASQMARWRLPYTATGDLDVCHWPFEEVFVRLPDVAHVVTLHDTIVLRFPEWFSRGYVAQFTRQLRRIARCATRIIADSENSRHDVIELLGVPTQRIDVVPLAPRKGMKPPENPAAQQSVLTRHGLHQAEYIFFVGAFQPRKNLVRLAAAFRTAMERAHKPSMRLVLAGKLGGSAEPIERELRALGLGERLVVPGRVTQEDLPALMHGARAVAYVSLYEGFGLPPLEAMSCGTPVVASNNSSISEVMGNAGLLVDPYSVEEIATALQRVITDDALRDDLIARGLAQAARFSWAKTAELTMETYRHAVASRRGTERP